MTIKQVNENSPIPKYYQVYSALLDLIKTGEIQPGTALPPTNALTKRFGVSRITLTKAMDMLEAEGIIERQQGRGTFACATSSTAPIVVGILNDLQPETDRYDRQYLWQAIVDGVQRVTSEHNYTLNLIGAQSHFEDHEESRPNVVMNQVDGIIFHPGSEVNEGHHALMQSAIDAGFPVVCVDRYYHEQLTDRAVFNDAEIGYELTLALINRGHQHIAFAQTSEPHVSSVKNRLAGYRQALADHGITFDDELILDIYSRPTPETHVKLLQRIEQNKFTAIFSANDPTTELLLFDLNRLNHDRLKEMNLRTGSDRSIDDLSSTEIVLDIAMIGDVISPYYRHYISLFARHSGHQLGEAAAKLLIGRIKGEITGPSQTVIVPMDIVELNE